MKYNLTALHLLGAFFIGLGLIILGNSLIKTMGLIIIILVLFIYGSEQYQVMKNEHKQN
jgi:phosphate/sulfate permease